MEIEMNSTPTNKKLGQLKQKAQASIGQVGRIHMNTKVKDQEAQLSYPQPNLMQSPSIKDKVTHGNE